MKGVCLYIEKMGEKRGSWTRAAMRTEQRSDLGMIVTMHTVNIRMIDVLPPVLKRLKKAKSD